MQKSRDDKMLKIISLATSQHFTLYKCIQCLHLLTRN